MTWHDEKEPPVYAAGERTAELEARGEASWQRVRRCDECSQRPCAEGCSGARAALAEHFEFACRGYLHELNRREAAGIGLSNAARMWRAVEEKRTACR